MISPIWNYIRYRTLLCNTQLTFFSMFMRVPLQLTTTLTHQ